MNTVWYCAHRDARGVPYVLRHEQDNGEEYVRPLPGCCMGEKFPHDWGRESLAQAALAIDLLGDALDKDDGFESAVWLDFEQQVIALLPLNGWAMTQEAIWDWYLAGLTIESLDTSAQRVLERGIA